MNIVLIGYRGTGKSTLGRLLAAELGLSFFDADEELERQAGRTIREIFASGGETEFRDLEANIVAELLAQEERVIALGGGAVLRAENRQAITNPKNRVVWVQAAASTLHARIEADSTTSARRPNLTAAGGLEEIERLLAFREPLYRACASFVIDTEDKPLTDIAHEIVTRIRK